MCGAGRWVGAPDVLHIAHMPPFWRKVKSALHLSKLQVLLVVLRKGLNVLRRWNERRLWWKKVGGRHSSVQAAITSSSLPLLKLYSLFEDFVAAPHRK